MKKVTVDTLRVKAFLEGSAKHGDVRVKRVMKEDSLGRPSFSYTWTHKGKFSSKEKVAAFL